MDNKNNRLFYWNVKDFVERKPVIFEQKKNSLKDTIAKVLNENIHYKTSSHVNDKNLVNGIHRQIERIALEEEKYVSSKTNTKTNSLANPFYLSEDISTEKKNLGTSKYSRITTISDFNPGESSLTQEDSERSYTPVSKASIFDKFKSGIAAAGFGSTQTGSNTGSSSSGSSNTNPAVTNPAFTPPAPQPTKTFPSPTSPNTSPFPKITTQPGRQTPDIITPPPGTQLSTSPSTSPTTESSDGVNMKSTDEELFDAADDAAAELRKLKGKGGDERKNAEAELEKIIEKLKQRKLDLESNGDDESLRRAKRIYDKILRVRRLAGQPV